VSGGFRHGTGASVPSHRSVSDSRSSNRTCRFPASGSDWFHVRLTQPAEHNQESPGSRQISLSLATFEAPRSEAPSLHGHYAASSVLRASPRPAPTTASQRCRASRPLVVRGLPTLHQTTLPACRPHYPGGPRRLHLSVLHHCTAAFLPLARSRRPHYALSRPAQDSLVLRPPDLRGAPTCASCLRGFSKRGCPPLPPG
jgi:hypothetical protein